MLKWHIAPQKCAWATVVVDTKRQTFFWNTFAEKRRFFRQFVSRQHHSLNVCICWFYVNLNPLRSFHPYSSWRNCVIANNMFYLASRSCGNFLFFARCFSLKVHLFSILYFRHFACECHAPARWIISFLWASAQQVFSLFIPNNLRLYLQLIGSCWVATYVGRFALYIFMLCALKKI